MRLLTDENFPKPIVEALRAGGHDVLWARTDLAAARDVVLDLAESQARIVLTLDKDFWQIAVQRRNPLAIVREVLTVEEANLPGVSGHVSAKTRCVFGLESLRSMPAC